MRKVCAVVLLLALYVTLSAWAVAAREIKGPLMIIRESTFDFTEVKEGEILEHTFKVLNEGGQSLEIEKIRTDCGCTKASYDRVIPPGSEGKIVLKVNTEGFKGNISEGAKVYTNDPQNKVVRINVTAFIAVPISVSPASVYFGGPVGSTIERVVTIQAQNPQPLFLKPVDFTLFDKVDYSIETLEKDRCFRIIFKNKSVTEEGYRGFLKLQTNCPDKPVITIPIVQVAAKIRAGG
ncbi:MAG: DUF1573 domain-containing protein [Syntrophales bacterium]|nr:DUF1573 domain-containing protein [Syntrophales bacterium]